MPEPHVRAAVGGDVQGVSAEVRFDYAEPLTTVTRGCFAKDQFIDSGETVSVPTPSGHPRALSLVQLRGVSVGGERRGKLKAGMIAEKKLCILTIGSDVLAGLALTVDPATRVLSIGKSQSREQYTKAQDDSHEHHFLEVSKDPKADWPLVTVRATQKDAQVMGPFILSLVEPQSAVVGEVAAEAGLSANSDLLDDLPLPAGIKLPAKLSARSFVLDALELSPGFGLKHASLQFIENWKQPAALGVIGADVWGRFRMTLDPAAGVLVLRRPRVFASGTRQQCAGKAPGELAEEACFQLGGHSLPRGAEAVVTVWRDLPVGARVYLDLLDAQGQPLRSRCQVGVTFPESDRGVSSRHRFPWAGLERTFPSCAEDFFHAKSVAFSLYEEGSLRECPGLCGFVHDVNTGRVSCECQSGLVNLSNAERKFLQMYRDLLKRGKSRETSPRPSRPTFDRKKKAPAKEEEPEPEE